MLPRASSMCVDVRTSARVQRAFATVVTSLVPITQPTRHPCQSSRDVANLTQFVWRELPRAPRAERAQRHRTETNSHQPIDLEVERVAQSPNLARATLRDRQLEFPSSLPERTAVDRPWQHQTVLE